MVLDNEYVRPLRRTTSIALDLRAIHDNPSLSRSLPGMFPVLLGLQAFPLLLNLPNCFHSIAPSFLHFYSILVVEYLTVN